MAARKKTSRKCSVEGCGRPHNSHGLCNMHGRRLTLYGDVGGPDGQTRTKTGLCTVEGCERKHLAKGFCGMHYTRVKRTGSPELPELLVCARCEAEFQRPYKGNPSAVRFCSHECRYADQLEQHRKNQAARYAYLKVWRKQNPDLLTAALLRRKSRKAGARVCEVSGRDLRRLVARFGGLCAYCKIRPHEHFDHVIPLAKGGRHAIGNLLPACSACNLSKGAKLLAEWRLLKPLPRRFRRRRSAHLLVKVS